MKILFVGEIVSDPGMEVVREFLPTIIKEHSPDLVLANVENLSGGRGFTKRDLVDMSMLGIDYFTGGDHIFWQRGTDEIIDELPVVRPANYPSEPAGKGYAIVDLGSKGKALIINVLGRTTFNSSGSLLEDPFRTVKRILEETSGENITASIVDFHGDGTSEKIAFSFYFDGKLTAVVGSHTHVPTCDGRFLPLGTGFITDVGMCGAIDSALGVKKEIVINMFLTGRLQRFEWESTGTKAFRSVLFDTDTKQVLRIDKLI